MKQLLFAGIAFLLLAISCNQANEKESLQNATIADVKLEEQVADTAVAVLNKRLHFPAMRSIKNQLNCMRHLLKVNPTGIRRSLKQLH
jgi:hypothetical protein